MTSRERCHHRQQETIGQQLGDRLLGDLESVLARVIREIGCPVEVTLDIDP